MISTTRLLVGRYEISYWLPFNQISSTSTYLKFVSLLMIAEIVSNGLFSLPSALAVVGTVTDPPPP